MSLKSLSVPATQSSRGKRTRAIALVSSPMAVTRRRHSFRTLAPARAGSLFRGGFGLGAGPFLLTACFWRRWEESPEPAKAIGELA